MNQIVVKVSIGLYYCYEVKIYKLVFKFVGIWKFMSLLLVLMFYVVVYFFGEKGVGLSLYSFFF